MKLLLDTHTFIWWDSDPSRLSATALALCQVSSDLLVLSVASIWEIQIKHQLGKLTLRTPIKDIVEQQNLFLIVGAVGCLSARTLVRPPTRHFAKLYMERNGEPGCASQFLAW